MSLSDLGNAQQLGGSQFAYVLSQISGKSLAEQNEAIPSTGEPLDLSTASKVLVPEPTEGSSAVSLAYANANYGGDSNQSLNEINAAHPLTGVLNLQSYPVLVASPQSNQQCANKTYVDTNIQTETTARINADTILQQNINTETNTRQTADQGLQDNIDQLSEQVWKRYPLFSDKSLSTYNAETIDALVTGTGAPLNVINQNYPLTGTLNLTAAPVLVGTPLLSSQAATKQYTDQLVISEAQARTQADNDLQAEIENLGGDLDQEIIDRAAGDAQILNTPLNAWPTPINGNLDMKQNQIVGLDTLLLGALETDAANVRFVNSQIASQAAITQALISTALSQANAYTDNEIGDISLSSVLAPLSTVSMAGQRLSNLGDPVDPQDAASRSWTLAQINTGTSGSLADINQQYPSNGQTIDLTGAIVKVATAISPTDALNLETAQQLIDDISLSSVLPPTQSVSMAGQRLSNVGDPVSDQDGANRQWVLQQITSGSGSLADINQQYPSNGQTIDLTGATVKVATAISSTDALNLETGQQLIADATAQSLADINENNPSTGQVLNLQGVDVRVESQNITSVNNPVSIQYMSDQLANYQLTSTPLNQIAAATGTLSLNQQPITDLTSLQADGNLSIKTNGTTAGSLVISQVNSNYTIANNNNIDLQTNGILTLNAGQYTQSTTPILSNSTANISANQVLNRSQNDARYYQSSTRINEIQSATGNIAMNGFTLSNIRDAVDILEPTNLAQVTSLIANSGFKNKIQSQSNHAQVICDNGSDNVEIKANNADSTIVIQASGSDYTIGNTGDINIQTSELNVNQNALRVLGVGGGASILLAGDLRSSALDLDLPDQILTRQQNDARYLSQSTTTLSSLPPPDTSVSFGNQLLRNLQSPILASDASTKAYIDNALLNYPTTGTVQATYLTKNDAAVTYRTESQVDSQITTALVPYSTTTQMNSAISSALVPYRLLTNHDNQILSTDGNTQLLANTGSSGISIKANGNTIGSILQAIGQTGFTPLQIKAVDKLQFIAEAGSTSFTSGTGDTTNGVYIASASDNTAALCWDQLIVGSGTNRQGLVLSSGHTDQNVPYNAISSNTTSSLQNLTITPETALVASQGGNQLTMYGNAAAALFPIQNQFNKPVGRTTTQTSALANEFLTKGLADTLYTGGGGGGAQIIDSGSNNSVTCTASNPGVILTNLKNILTSVQIGSATSTGAAIAFQSASGPTGGINALSGPYYIEHISNGQGFKFMDNLGSGYMFLKSAAKAAADGTSQVIFATSPQVNTAQTNPLSNELIQASYADLRYALKGVTLNNIPLADGNLSMNGFRVNNLSPGTIASGNTSSVTGGDVYDYIATLPSVITQQVYTVTVFGSTTNGFQWTAFTNSPANNTVQCQRVKGSGAQMITSSTITSQSQTLVADFASLQFQVANANVRVTQVVPYTTTAFSTPGQQNIASLTFSQQAISSTATCVQLYKPQGNQGSAAFILYVYVDQF